MQIKGKQAMEIWDYIIQYFKDEKDTENQSYLNCLYNRGRILTKMFINDKIEMRENLIKALKNYETIRDTIEEMKLK